MVHFVLVTDHKPITAVFNPEKDQPAVTAARLQQYALFLAGHRYSIKYRNTHEHANADGLSRLLPPVTQQVIQSTSK